MRMRMIQIVTITFQRFCIALSGNLSQQVSVELLFDDLISYHQEGNTCAKGDENGSYQEGLCSNFFVIHLVHLHIISLNN